MLEQLVKLVVRAAVWSYFKGSDLRSMHAFRRQIPLMREHEIRTCEDEELLLEIARRHPHASLQAMATGLIKEPAKLHNLAMDHSLPECVREAAVRIQTDERNLLVAIFSSGDVLVAQTAVERLKRPSSFEVVLDPQAMRMVTVRRIAAAKCPAIVLTRLSPDPDPDVQDILNDRLARERPFTTPGSRLAS